MVQHKRKTKTITVQHKRKTKQAWYNTSVKQNKHGTTQAYIFAFIRPVLEYGDVVWGNCTKKSSDLLESLQIEAGQIITGLRCNSSRQKLYHELG